MNAADSSAPSIHEITLRVSDSDGEIGSTSVHIMIDDSVVVPGPDEAALAQCETVFARYDNGDFTPMTVDEEDQEPGSGGMVIWVAVGGAVAVALSFGAGIAYYRWRHTRSG